MGNPVVRLLFEAPFEGSGGERGLDSGVSLGDLIESGLSVADKVHDRAITGADKRCCASRGLLIGRTSDAA